MLPWIVLPLVTAASGEGGRLRAAARSGLAIACCGGINATATVAVLVVPVVYVLTRPRGTFRARMLAWWSVCAGAATAWWLAPLLLTGTYGFSWLTYTEKAETTTGPTGLINVLRGAERWVNYLIVDGQVWWPVGHGLSLGPLPILCTGVVAALGLAGLLSGCCRSGRSCCSRCWPGWRSCRWATSATSRVPSRTGSATCWTARSRPCATCTSSTRSSGSRSRSASPTCSSRRPGAPGRPGAPSAAGPMCGV